MSPLGLGLHTSPYYNNLSHPNVDERLEEAGVTTLRYGGGGYADVFHWSITRAAGANGIPGGGLSPWWGEAGNFGYVGSGSDFASFVRLLDRTDDSRAVVTVNYGSALKLENSQSVVPDYGGQPQEAAAWVAYANAVPAIYGTPQDVPIGVDQQGNDWKTAGYWARLRASTESEYDQWAAADGLHEPLNRFLAINRDEPVGVKFWEVGNETFGTGYYDGGDGYSVDYDVPYGSADREFNEALSPAQYGQEVATYAQLMRSVDPSIKIGAVLATPPDDYGWSYADHDRDGQKDANEPYWNDEVLANAGGEVDFAVVHWYPWAGENANGDSLLGYVGDKLPRMIYGTTPEMDSGADAGLRDTLVAHGLPEAEIMVTEFNFFGSLQGTREDAAKAMFVADAYASWLEMGVTSIQYLELLTNKDFVSDSSGLERGSAFYGVSMVDRLAKPGDAFVTADSTEENLRAHAALRADGSVAVMLLNLDRTSAAEVAVDVAGAQLADEGVAYTLTDGLTLSEAHVAGLSGPFTATVSPRSIALYVIPAAGSAPGDFNADGSVTLSDYVVWREGLGTVYGAEQYQEWLTHYGGPGATLWSSDAVPEPDAALLMAGAAAAVGFGTRCAATSR